MGMNQISRVLGAIVLASMVAGCASTNGANNIKLNNKKKGHANHLKFFDVASSLYNTKRHASIAYFKFDSASLLPQAKKVLTEQAQDITKTKMPKVWVYGYADLRGTEDYNIALGARRAKAVADFLRVKGVKAPILKKSYGKSLKHQYNPSNTSEEGYALNRRVIACGDKKNCALFEHLSHQIRSGVFKKS